MTQEQGQERTEEATPKRLQEAAEKGQIARSRELSTLGMLMAAAGGLMLLGPGLLEELVAQMRAGLMLDVRTIFDSKAIPAIMGQALTNFLLMLAPFLLLMLVVALLAPMALGGVSFSAKALVFKGERIDPIKGVGRLFSWRALMELIKALAKFLVVAAVAVFLLWIKQAELLHLGTEPLLPALTHTAQILGWIFLILTLPMLLVAGVDVPFQLFDHARQLRMTKQEVKDEMKDTDGKPEVKSRIRRLQQEFAQRRMMEKVPTADAIITNPTHYAVALKYDQDTMKAPVVVAKGQELVALNIRSLGARYKVPRVESPLLARALYFNSDLDKPIPVALYVAVAQVLVYLFQLREARRLDDKPVVMNDIPVPSGLRTE